MTPATETMLSGIYANFFMITTQPDGIVRIVFRDQIGGTPVDRAHIVLTNGNASLLAKTLMTMLYPSGSSASGH